ncbi:hypothetical protein HDU79_011922, partial [Rhizoclosmatium sp. JEL0117]
MRQDQRGTGSAVGRTNHPLSSTLAPDLLQTARRLTGSIYPVPGTRLVFVAYVRKSVESDSGSLPQQLALIQKWAAANAHDIHPVVFKDVQSGADASRPGLLASLQLIRSNPAIAGLVTYKVDRLSRNSRDSMGIIESLVNSRKVYASASESDMYFGTQTIDSAIAEIERIKTGQVTRNHMQVKRDQGLPVGRNAPYGCRFLAKYADGQVKFGFQLDQLRSDSLSITVVPCLSEQRQALSGFAYFRACERNRISPSRAGLFHHVVCAGVYEDCRETGAARARHYKMNNLWRGIQSYVRRLEKSGRLGDLDRDEGIAGTVCR